MITMLLYVLFSWAAFDFPIHTLWLLHSLALASQLTLCTLFASVLSGFSTNSAFSVSLPFPRPSEHVSRNARGQGHAGPFHENCPLKKTQRHIDVPTMPRLSPPFIHDATCIWRYLERKQQPRVSSANFACTFAKFSDFMLTTQVA